jgi:SAM-dependent methyltransferase
MKEYEIRPNEIYAEFLRLAAKDAATNFDHSKATLRNCPACGESTSKRAFVKMGFTFCECQGCGTLFANPLPPTDAFAMFYRDSRAARYWADVFVPRVMEKRRVAIVRPRVERIRDLCRQRGIDPKVVLDMGAGHGMFLEEWRAIDPGVQGYAVEPNATLAGRCRELGFNVYEGPGESADEHFRGVADVATCFEVVEHVPKLIEFVSSMQALLRPGGLAVVTTLGCDGFDIQLLWNEANCICPPSHVNFCSRKGFACLFERAGFTDVEVLTPGELDVDIVRNKLAEKEIALSRFERLILSSGPETLADFQSFLQRHRLSSHSWVVARKPTHRK